MKYMVILNQAIIRVSDFFHSELLIPEFDKARLFQIVKHKYIHK